MEDVKTSVELWDIQILEPVTVVTDLLVSVVCLYAYFKLRKLKTQSAAVKLFAYYFLTLSLATASGGIVGHGLQNTLGFGWKVPTWIISMISITFIERTAIIHARPLLSKRTTRFFLTFNIVELITMVVAAISTLNFLLVEAQAAFGLLAIVFSFELYIFIKKRNEESRILLIAVGVSALPAIVHLSKFSIDRWFNYNDIAHVLMAVAAYVFYLGAIKVHTIHSASNKSE